MVTLITVGLVLGPQLVGNQKTADTYDFLWSLPVPRTTQAAAWTTVNAVIALPGMLAALLIADWRYDIPLHVSPSIVPAVLLTIVTATMVGLCLRACHPQADGDPAHHSAPDLLHPRVRADQLPAREPAGLAGVGERVAAASITWRS